LTKQDYEYENTTLEGFMQNKIKQSKTKQKKKLKLIKKSCRMPHENTRTTNAAKRLAAAPASCTVPKRHPRLPLDQLHFQDTDQT
jgi:hypothetical protein